VEQAGREPAGVSRSQNAIFVMPHDWAAMAQFLGPLVERIDPSQREPQILVIASDAEVAAAIAASAVRVIGSRDIGVAAATSVARASRLLRIRPAQMLVGAPDTLLGLVRAAALKLDAIRTVCMAWADELVTSGATAQLETIMAELPKDAGRTLVTSELNAGVEDLVERYARRARRVVAPAAVEASEPIPVQYVTVARQARLTALRRVLDQLDPKSAVVFTRDEDSEGEVGDLLRSLGYGGADSPVRMTRVAAPGTDLAVLFDLPVSREELRESAAGAARAVALVQPRQIASLRALSGGSVTSLALTDSADRARERDARMRAELGGVLAEGRFGRELLALEPLLDDHDAIEIAAAALQLLERERTAVAQRAATAPAPSGAAAIAARGPMARLFVNVGARDGVRPSDIVGAITNQADTAGTNVGRVDVRESHSIVEVAATVADDVIERVTGSSIKGRRAIVRRDEERPPREGGRPPREGGRPPREGGRPPREGGRPSREGGRPPRPGGRGPAREGGRGGPRDRGSRPAGRGPRRGSDE
jgi:ATP-dependent RNA helicase DeaD